MDKNRLIELLTKKESGIITLPETRELNEYLINNTDDKIIADALTTVLAGSFIVEQAYQPDEIQRHVKNLHDKINTDLHTLLSARKPGKSRLIIMISTIAASLILGIAGYYFIYSGRQSHTVAKNVLSTKKGSKSTLELPDGTKVWLNADTRLTYDKNYGEKTRAVELTGEAYFDVVKDADHPFIVRTKFMDVKVLGTAFNVRAYDNEVNTQATLIRGKVEVYLRNKTNEKIILKPNEKIIVKNNEFHNNNAPVPTSRNAPEMSVINIQLNNTADSTANEIQWTKNRLIFDQTDFSEVIRELERWYGVKIMVKDSSVLERRLSGIFENESLPEVLESFKLAAGFNYRISDNILTIYK
ncbi:FecR family protein [Niabella aquatica]